MKIRIPVAALRIGMFIDSMEGSWWRNPFWKTCFLITSRNELDRLSASGLEWVVVDDARGTGVDQPAGSLPSAPAAPPTPKAPRRQRGSPRALAVTDFEAQRAAATVEQSKREVMRMFTDVRMGKAIKPDAMVAVVDQICHAVGEDVGAVLKVTRLKKKNEYTYLHSVAVSALMIALARQLKLDEEMVRQLGLAGLLHDIGKMALPEEVLEKPGRLTDQELQLVRLHPEEGHAMLSEGEVPPVVIDVILHHHEKIDGSGYPHRLSGDALSLPARIGAVCDVYDAVTSKRSYKRQWTPSEALTEMRSWTGHFDPVLIDAFMRCIGIYPVGLLVRLRSNRLAIVRNENIQQPTQPTVCVFYQSRDACFIDPIDLRLSDGMQGDAVVGIEDEERWFPGDWDRVRETVLAGARPDRRRTDIAPLRAMAS